MRLILPAAIGLAVVLSQTAPLMAQGEVTFQQFPVTGVFIQAMSADGSVVVGKWILPPSKSAGAFRWTAAGGVEDIGGDMDAVYISRDGKTIVARAADSKGVKQAAIWQSGKDWKLLGGFPNGTPDERSVLSSGNGVSADGSVVIGIATFEAGFHAFRWDAKNGMVDLGSLQKDSSVAVAISADGNIIVGFDESPPGGQVLVSNNRVGAVFASGLERFLHAFGWAGEARATNNNGSIIVGRTHPLGGRFLPDGTFQQYSSATTYMYTAWDGRFYDLGAAVKTELSEKLQLVEYGSLPYGVSDDGRVVGGITGQADPVASIWTAATGMLRMSDYLTANGITAHQGLKLTFTSYVSPDGKRLAGTAVGGQEPNVLPYSWIVTLP
jgi:probable HAF family extracellular repeat protein